MRLPYLIDIHADQLLNICTGLLVLVVIYIAVSSIVAVIAAIRTRAEARMFDNLHTLD